jgi:phosphonate transport system substrate-binding protein
VAAYRAGRLAVPVRLEIEPPWQERERLFDAGQIDLCWICGLPYVWKADHNPGKIRPLVAPVMAGKRYRDRPVYYSDVVVRRESAFWSLADLRGSSWAYNEPNSHSGYGVVRYALAMEGKTLDFFGRLVESGAHQVSLQMVLDRDVDASAIDSTVLELELARNPAIIPQLRVIDTFGPSPIPPWVVSNRVPAESQQALQESLIGMENDPRGREILKSARMARFTTVDDHDYDPIREMRRVAFQIS